MTTLSRRTILTGSAALLVTPSRLVAGQTVRIGYQKYGNLLLLKASGQLEKRLAPLGWSVDWREFLAGPALLEALGAGAIDFGSAGETPPIFAQAAGFPIVYLGSEPASPDGEAILVKSDSKITSLSDLRGKSVAFNKGSNVHVLYVKSLAKAGLSLKDVKAVYLAPPDGRAAFARGSVDAWVIWDPFLAAAQAAGGTRVLADGRGLVANRQFYIGSRRFQDHKVLATITDAIAAIDRETKGHVDQAASVISPSVGLPAPVVKTALSRQAFAFQPIDAATVADQQTIADTFFQLGLIPKAVRIADAVT